MANGEHSTAAQQAARSWGSVLPHIYDRKGNQVVLIDGRRGSGKTTTLLNLLQYLNERFWGRGGGAPVNKTYDEETQKIRTGSPGVDASRIVIPLGLIHLSPIPHDANLFVYLATQFRKVINHIEEEVSGGGYLSSQAELESTNQWKQFMAIAGTAWNGNLHERRANLDADSYAMELEQTEGLRVQFRESFYRLIDALCKDAERVLSNGRPTGKSPLWVIPIDDADMNPAQSKKLLFLLRTLWHPRVAYLLTGDQNLFRQILRSHVLAELTEPLKDLSLFGRKYDAAEVLKQSRKLAQDIYDKVLPPGHHCLIDDLDPDERYEKLIEPLPNVKIDLHKKISFTLDPELPVLKGRDSSDIGVGRIFEVVAATRHALPGRMRTLMNLIGEIDSYKEIKRENLQRFIKERWRYFVDKDMNSTTRKSFVNIFLASPNNEMSVCHRDYFEIQLLRQEDSMAHHMLITGHYSGFTGSFLPADKQKATTENTDRTASVSRMSEDLLATLLLAISAFPFTRLFDARPAGDVVDWRGKLTNESLNSAFVRTWHDAWQIDGGNASLFKQARDLIWVGFPIPDWESPFMWMLMNSFWKALREEKDGYQEIVRNFFLAVLWTNGITANRLAEHRIVDIVNEKKRETRPSLDDVLTEIREQADKAGGLHSQRKWDFINWALGLASLVAAPESLGTEPIDEQDLNIVTQSLEKFVFEIKLTKRDRIMDMIHKNRTQRIMCALKMAGIEQDKLKEAAEIFINHIDKKSTHRKWTQLFGSPGAASS